MISQMFYIHSEKLPLIVLIYIMKACPPRLRIKFYKLSVFRSNSVKSRESAAELRQRRPRGAKMAGNAKMAGSVKMAGDTTEKPEGLYKSLYL
jgi:hypothetical protein